MTGRRWLVARWAFVVAVVVSVGWSWRTSGDEISRAVAEVGPGRVAVAIALVVLGLLPTAAVWRTSLGSFGPTGTVRAEAAPFFLAQLGKYVPGSVWSFAAQGALGAARGWPARVPAAAAVLFLGVHLASGLLAVGVVGWWTTLPWWVVGAALLAGGVGVAPTVHRVVGGRLAGRPCAWDLARSGRACALMVPTWLLYAGALAVLAPPRDPRTALLLGCAFVLAFAVGVAVPVAPAGLGARDGVLVLLLAPALGVGAAGAVAVLARLAHTVADGLLGALAWWRLRPSRRGRAGHPVAGAH